MSNREPLRLVAGLWYAAEDFERFEYLPPLQRGEVTILRLHMKNGCTLDLPASQDELARLAIVLTEAHGPKVIAHLRERGWI